MTENSSLEGSYSERPALTGLSPEQEQQEAEKYFQAFISAAEHHEKLKANFRLEKILILTENQELRAEYLEKLLSHIETITTQQEKELSFSDELTAVHSLLTISESLREGASIKLIQQFAPRLYQFTHINNAIISGMAHQQFLSVLNNITDKNEKRRLLEQLGS